MKLNKALLLLIPSALIAFVLFQNAGVLANLGANQKTTWFRQPVSGSIVSVDSTKITGWVANTTAPNEILVAKFSIDGVDVGSVRADQENSVVSDALCAGPCGHGFSFSIPPVYADGNVHQLQVSGMNSLGQSSVVQAIAFSSGGANAVNATGTNSDDYLNGSFVADTLTGQGGNDELHGGPGKDSIHGNTGADIIYGDEGDDTLLGGKDNDIIYGGSGSDQIFGDNGDDFQMGESGDDRYAYPVGGGFDVIDDTEGANVLTCDERGYFSKQSPDAVLKLPSGSVTFKGSTLMSMSLVGCVN